MSAGGVCVGVGGGDGLSPVCHPNPSLLPLAAPPLADKKRPKTFPRQTQKGGGADCEVGGLSGRWAFVLKCSLSAIIVTLTENL